jgi:hypothetical protein
MTKKCIETTRMAELLAHLLSVPREFGSNQGSVEEKHLQIYFLFVPQYQITILYMTVNRRFESKSLHCTMTSCSLNT